MTKVILKHNAGSTVPTSLDYGEAGINYLKGSEKISIKNTNNEIVTLNDWSQILNKPASLPASDVYSWAKASTKPAYTYNEIASKPTTLAGYGITDGALSSHTHSYLPLSGGTLTGSLMLDAGLSVTNVSTFKGTSETDKPPLSAEMLTTSNWTTNGWTGSFTNDFTNTEGNTQSLSNSIAAVSGNRYLISLSTMDGGDGSINVSFGGTSKIVSGDDSASFGVVASNTNKLVITPTSDFIGTIYGVSIKLITGVISPLIVYRNTANYITNEIRSIAGENVHIGTNAGRYSVGSRNTGIGSGTLYTNIAGSYNTALGSNSLFNIVNGNMNTSIGAYAGTSNVFGTNNIFLGYSAGSYTNAGLACKNPTNSILIGSNTKALYDNGINEIVIGSYSAGLGSNTTSIGTPDTTTTRVYGNLYATGEITAYQASDKRLKKNIVAIENTLDIIDKLNPVTYNWNEKAKELNSAKTDNLDSGLIAQELEEVLPNLVHEMDNGYKSIDYIKVIPYLIGAIKEQQKQINELKDKLNI